MGGCSTLWRIWIVPIRPCFTELAVSTLNQKFCFLVLGDFTARLNRLALSGCDAGESGIPAPPNPPITANSYYELLCHGISPSLVRPMHRNIARFISNVISPIQDYMISYWRIHVKSIIAPVIPQFRRHAIYLAM